MVLDDFIQQAPAPHPFNASLRRVRRGALGSGRPVGAIGQWVRRCPGNLHILGKDHKNIHDLVRNNIAMEAMSHRNRWLDDFLLLQVMIFHGYVRLNNLQDIQMIFIFIVWPTLGIRKNVAGNLQLIMKDRHFLQDFRDERGVVCWKKKCEVNKGTGQASEMFRLLSKLAEDQVESSLTLSEVRKLP